jgi:hypothetical protein
MNRIRNVALAAASLLALSACTSDSSPEMPAPGLGPMACDRAAAERLVGQPRPTDEAARAATGASTVRQIGPGDPVTRDFRPNRVTIETDPATGTVTAASCG